MHNISVLIVGAGPTGMTLACELARRNISCRIIERSKAYPNGSRAKGLQPRSQEVFDDLGIIQKLLDAGTTDLIFRRYQGNHMVGESKRDVFPRDDARYLQSLVIPQWKVEETLREKLWELGAAVELGTEMVGLTQNEDTVTAQLQTASGIEQFACDFMVACDGGKSKTRKMLGINFVGETHEDEKVLVGDVEVEGLVPVAWHIWMHPQLGFGFALCPFKCTNSWQLQAVAVPDANGNLPVPGLETFQQLFAERTNMQGVVLKNATWESLYRVNVRMADKYRVGRVFIAGDAAHAHSIAGGLGMNTGIQDAYNLGWKMASVLTGEADPTLLDTYEEERLPIAAWTLNISSERQRVMQQAVTRGTGGFETSATKDTTQLNLNYRFSSLSVNNLSADGKLHSGDRAPDAVLSDGSRLFDLYRGVHLTVLAFGGDSKMIDNVNNSFGGKVKAHTITDKKAAAVFGNLQGFIVIRPDGYIGLTAPAEDEGAVMGYIQRFIKKAASVVVAYAFFSYLVIC